MTQWQNRIVRTHEVPVSALTANPHNWREHPPDQRAAMRHMLDTVGFADPIKVQAGTLLILDGHLRVELAKEHAETTILVCELDVDDAEAALILATFDPVAWLADTKKAQARALLDRIGKDRGEHINNILNQVRQKTVEPPARVLPRGDRSPFESMTMTVTREQAGIVRLALDRAKAAGPFGDTGNGNANGNAFARICSAYLGDDSA